MWAVLLAAGLLLIGEVFNIFAEMRAATTPPSALFQVQNLYLFLLVIIGCSFLLFGYSYGYTATKNIWIITAASVGGILVVEPILAYTLFQQMPEKGALLGLILGAIGLIVTVAWR